MAYCDDCGFYIEDDDCDMCTSSYTDIEEDTEKSEQSATSTWWYYIAIAPAMLLFAAYLTVQTGQVPIFPYLITLLMYSISVVLDVRYISTYRTGWEPNSVKWATLAGINVLLGGVPTFIMTPWYLYKRRQTKVK